MVFRGLNHLPHPLGRTDIAGIDAQARRAGLRRLDRASARNLFLASLAYLPVVLVALAADRGPASGVAGARGGRTALQESR